MVPLLPTPKRDAGNAVAPQHQVGQRELLLVSDRPLARLSKTWLWSAMMLQLDALMPLPPLPRTRMLLIVTAPPWVQDTPLALAASAAQLKIAELNGRVFPSCRRPSRRWLIRLAGLQCAFRRQGAASDNLQARELIGGTYAERGVGLARWGNGNERLAAHCGRRHCVTQRAERIVDVPL